ncbi:hypothetical protein ARMGADRAFT_1092901 [Armillaria gallica]|uniref:Uncharacterized protein n=1 Tax=Armillaria gallica TaxID=47427 RepID=A0A2H3CKF6_ARMGA|nr:hypothetical protein ARMGADRAFT_1092901 [Armillaria gallica]
MDVPPPRADAGKDRSSVAIWPHSALEQAWTTDGSVHGRSSYTQAHLTIDERAREEGMAISADAQRCRADLHHRHTHIKPKMAFLFTVDSPHLLDRRRLPAYSCAFRFLIQLGPRLRVQEHVGDAVMLGCHRYAESSMLYPFPVPGPTDVSSWINRSDAGVTNIHFNWFTSDAGH